MPVADNAIIGKDVKIWHYVNIGWEGGHPVIIGDYCSIGSYCEIGPGVRIGRGTRLNAGCKIYGPAEIGAGCLFGPGVLVLNDKYPSFSSKRPMQGPTIGNNAVIGGGAIIVGSVKVGDGAVIGAGAVVIHDVPRGAIVVGNPARQIGEREEHYPGTAIQHWGPIGPEPCEFCKGVQDGPVAGRKQ